MKIGITGATGQLGTIVLEKLKAKIPNENLVALVRSPQKASQSGVEVRAFDYEHPATLVASLKGIEKLLLISGSEPGKRLQQHSNVINAAKEAGVKFIVYTSLLHADTSTLVLAHEHLETEKFIKAAGIPYTILRHGWYTENYFGGLEHVVSSGELLGSSGNGKISAATRADFADADVAVLTTKGHENKTYELAGDEAFTLSDLARVISEVTKKTIVYRNLSVEEYAKALILAGLPEGVAHFLAGTHVATEKGDLFDNSGTISKLTGKPTTTLKQAVSDALKVK